MRKVTRTLLIIFGFGLILYGLFGDQGKDLEAGAPVSELKNDGIKLNPLPQLDHHPLLQIPKPKPELDLVNNQLEVETMYNTDHKRSKSLKVGSQGYLFIEYFPPEQLTKARIHFSEALFLASKLNRIAILPGMYAGMFGLEKRYTQSPCIFFDCQHLGELVDWMLTPKYLSTHLKNGDDAISFYLTSDSSRCPKENTQETQIEFKRITLRRTALLCSAINDSTSAMQTEELIQRMLGLSATKHIFYRKRTTEPILYDPTQLSVSFPLYATVFHQFTWYNPLLLAKAADFMLGPLHGKPYISLQWRLEGRSSQDITACVDYAIETIESLRAQTGINLFYLAVDWSSNGTKSMSCKECKSDELDRQMERFVNATNAIMYEDFPEFIPPQDSVPYLGIFDKIILILSKEFLSMKRPCARRNSSYTRYISEMRALANFNTTELWFKSKG